MNKKTLLGTIIALCILIGVSFTSVVGYRSVESGMKESPLFTVRTSRAIDEESGDLSCEYVGKGEVSNILFTKFNERIESLEFLIKALRNMDDTSLRRFSSLIIYQIHRTNDIQKLDYEEIYLSLKQLRNTPDTVIKHIQERKDSKMMSNACTAPWVMCTIDVSLECLPYIILMILVILYVFIMSSIDFVISLLTIDNRDSLWD